MKIKTAVLAVLTACGGYAITAPTLKIEVEMTLGTRIGQSELSRGLASLKREKSISTRPDPITGDLRWFKPAA